MLILRNTASANYRDLPPRTNPLLDTAPLPQQNQGMQQVWPRREMPPLVSR
jgi:hypothetical protein